MAVFKPHPETMVMAPNNPYPDHNHMADIKDLREIVTYI